MVDDIGGDGSEGIRVEAVLRRSRDGVETEWRRSGDREMLLTSCTRPLPRFPAPPLPVALTGIPRYTRITPSIQGSETVDVIDDARSTRLRGERSDLEGANVHLCVRQMSSILQSSPTAHAIWYRGWKRRDRGVV